MLGNNFITSPLRFAFSSYAIIGLTLVIIATSIAVYLLGIKPKNSATKSFILFNICIALSGAATILSNAIIHWGSIFMPWQDFWILLGGYAFSQFAYRISKKERTKEAKIVLSILASLIFLAFVYCVVFSYRVVFNWEPGLDVSDYYYALLPIGILMVVFVFLRNALQLSGKEQTKENTTVIGYTWANLVHPQTKDARALRNFAIALLLAFLPAVQTLVGFPPPYGFILSNIGSILAIIAIAMVYFNYAPDITSFLPKLVGITLATVLLLFSIFGSVDIFLESSQYSSDRLDLTIAIFDVLINNEGELSANPPDVAYIVSWDENFPDDGSRYQLIFIADNVSFQLETLIEDNLDGRVINLSQPLRGELFERSNTNWRLIRRFWQYPEGSTHEDYLGYIFNHENFQYEIGYSGILASDFVSNIVIKWMILTLISSVFILLVFPVFFDNVLVQPIRNLLDGIHQVNRGDLETNIQPRFHDEIGSLTISFNGMVDSLNSLTNSLQQEADKLGLLVNQRTQELVQANLELTYENKERENAEIILNQQLLYQQALADCSQSLLRIRDSETNQRDILDQALESLRVGAEASRSYIFRISKDKDPGLFVSMIAETCAPGIHPHINNPINQKFPVSILPSNFVDQLNKGENFGGSVEKLFDETPFLRDNFLNQSPPLLSIQTFPIFINDQFWGFIGFDECTYNREWNEWEITMLQTASEMIGNTIHRWEIEDHLQETLDQLELRVAKRTTELSESNRMLNLEIQQRQSAQNDLESRLFIEERLSKISSRLLKTHQINTNIKSSLKDLAQIMEAGRIFLIQFDINNYAQIIEFIEWHKPKIQPVTEEIVNKYIESMSGFRERLRNQETIFIPDIYEFASNQDSDNANLAKLSIQSLVLSPLVISKRIHGVLGCGMLESSPETLQVNISILDLVASMFTSLIQRQQLIQNLESQVAERTRQLTTFLDVAMFGENAQNLTDVLQPLIRSVSQLVISDAVTIHILDKDKDEFILTAQHGIPQGKVDLLRRVEKNPDMDRWIDQSVAVESSMDLKEDMIFPKAFYINNFQKILASRVSTGNNTLGLLFCYRGVDQSFSSLEKTFLSGLGELVGIIVENFRLRMEAKELATIDERQRLAREIHDAISQSVYSLSLFARSASDALSTNNENKLSENLKDIEKIALQAMREMRLLLYQLREETDDQDLAAALDIRFKQVENRLGIEAAYEIDKKIILPEKVRHHIWRIFVEALNNSVKHANANHVFIQMEQKPSWILVSVQDDGVGFNVNTPSPGMGLKNIKARVEKMGGTWEFDSEPGQGTQIYIQIPNG
jgi:signal transduction histidine kinase/HAMP domain-containing protein